MDMWPQKPIKSHFITSWAELISTGVMMTASPSDIGKVHLKTVRLRKFLGSSLRMSSIRVAEGFRFIASP